MRARPCAPYARRAPPQAGVPPGLCTRARACRSCLRRTRLRSRSPRTAATCARFARATPDCTGRTARARTPSRIAGTRPTSRARASWKRSARRAPRRAHRRERTESATAFPPRLRTPHARCQPTFPSLDDNVRILQKLLPKAVTNIRVFQQPSNRGLANKHCPALPHLLPDPKWGRTERKRIATCYESSAPFCLTSSKSSTPMAIVCLIGFHSAFFTRATSAIGM